MRNLLLILLVFASSVTAQKIDFKQFKGIKARAIGPAGTSGRITSIDVVRDQPHVIVIGTASGGVWKSESGGTSWIPIFDEQPIQNIGAVTIDPNNAAVIWVGTGEGNPRNSHSSGKGIYRSLDGGTTWKLMGLEATKTIHRIIVDPQNSNTIYAASLGSIWGPNSERGVYKSIDGGQSWEQILYVNDSTGCGDLIMDPSNPNKLYAGMWQYQRQPWFFNSGGAGSGLHVTVDGGKTWKRLGKEEGLPSGTIGRIGLAMSAANNKIIYALVESKKTALYKSIDGGEKFKMVNSGNVGDRPFYYADIYADPKNENKLYNLYSRVSKSVDGGKSFDVILPYYRVHPDHHSFYIHPDNPNFIIDGNDGGLNISYNGGKSWEFIDNLPVSQFYHIRVDNLFPYNIYGGMQDNGSWIGPAEVWQWGGIQNRDWQEILFGDGFDVMPKLDAPGKAYAMYQGGGLNLVDRTTGETEYLKPVAPDSIGLRFSWNAALSQDPFDPNTIYFGSQFVHRSRNGGRSWDIISPDLSTNDSSKLQQSKSGGLTIDVTNAENHCTVTAIEVSKLDRKLIWVGTDDGNIQVSQDGGMTWNLKSPSGKKDVKNAYITQVRPSKFKRDEIYLVMNNYRQNDFNTYLYHSKDLGENWQRLELEGVDGYALSFLQDPREENLLFLGTEQGLYISIDKGENWSVFNNNYPRVSTMDLAFQKREKDLVIGTFGRSAYVIDNLESLRSLCRKEWSLQDSLKITGTGGGYLIQYKQGAGARFVADGTFKGMNEPYGANIDFYVLPEIYKKGGKAGFEFLLDGKKIRNFKASVDSGLNRIYWGLRKNGVRYPSHATLPKDADPPAGRWVKPGMYQVVISLGDSISDTSSVQVFPDPRYKFEDFYYDEYESNGSRADSLIDKVFNSYQILKEVEKGLQLYKKVFEYKHDTIPKKEKDSLAGLIKEVKRLKELYMLKEGTKGYHYQDHLLSSYLWPMNAYYGLYHKPSSMADIQYQKAFDKMNLVHIQVKDFILKHYHPYISGLTGYDYLKKYEITF